jgi:biopolymer transport protein ExbB/TolQ
MITEKLLSISLLGTEWILYLLILLSVFSWAIMLERFLFLLRKRGNIEQLEGNVQGLLQKGELDKTLQRLEQDQSSPALVAAKVIRQVTKNSTHTGEYIEVVLSQEKLQLESRIAFLGTIVSIAPIMGLL